MHHETLEPWQHDHRFGQHEKKEGETRTLWVILLTGSTMVLEIAAGILFGSMALLADGLHMASHAVALAIAWFAYRYARKRADDRRFTFGTGKVNALGGFAGATLLGVFALVMGWESVERLLFPVTIRFDWAIAVAVVGLLVNGASVLILGAGHDHGHDHGHGHDHEHDRGGGSGSTGQDHNLRSAYLHVLADALTSVFAIVALLAGKYLGLVWLDPVMGLVGMVLVARWSVGLLRSTSRVLLDVQAPEEITGGLRDALTTDDGDVAVADLHVWSIGPGIYSAEAVLVADEPRPVRAYKERVPDRLPVEHLTLEVHPCVHEGPPAATA